MASRPRTSGSDPAGSSSARIADLEPVLRRVAIDVVTAEVSEALRAAGMRCILLKGPALTRWLYPRGEERSYLDVDLLVSEANLARAEKLQAPRVFTRPGRATSHGAGSR